MASPSVPILIHLLLVFCFEIAGTSAYNYNKNFMVNWGQDKAKILNGGRQLALSLDKVSGSAFESKNKYLFVRVDMDIKLVPDNSAGTVTTFYLSSTGRMHDEIDFEFLGNQSGQPYTVHTNVYSQGQGGREQQFKLWFDPTKDFHTYSIAWSPTQIIFLIDETPIRVFKNMETIGVPFPKGQPMKIYASLWNADDWATQGGRIKTDWSKAPFVATYGKYRIRGCNWSKRRSACDVDSTRARPTSTSDAWVNQDMNNTSHDKMNRVRQKYMIYDYCADRARFPQGPPPDCNAA